MILARTDAVLATVCVILTTWMTAWTDVASGAPVQGGLATPARKQELKERLKELVTDRFEGDPLKTFNYYDANQDGEIDPRELSQLLKDAGVGNWLTRGLWVSGVFGEADTNGDGMISVAEFQAAVKR